MSHIRATQGRDTRLGTPEHTPCTLYYVFCMVLYGVGEVGHSQVWFMVFRAGVEAFAGACRGWVGESDFFLF